MSFRNYFTHLTGGNKQAATFLLFVMLSAVIWTINALSKEHTTTFDIPIRYFQTTETGANQSLPTKLHITVHGKGFYLMRLSTALNGFAIVPKTMSVQSRDTVISSDDALRPVLEHFKGKLEVTSYAPEQILLSGRLLFSKNVRVMPSARLQFKPTHLAGGPSVIQPDTVTLYSSLPIPDSLRNIYTTPFTLENIDRDVFQQVKVRLPGTEYHLAAATFWYFLPVEKATEMSLDVPIRNKQKAVNEQYLPSTVRLTCKVPLSKFRVTRPDLFLITPGDTSVGGDKVLVQVKHAPYWATSVTIDPTVVNRVIKAGY